MQVNIKNLVDDGQCYQTVRDLRWPDGVACPSCESKHVIKRGCDDTERFCRKFSFEAICDMISLYDQRRLMREKDDGHQF